MRTIVKFAFLNDTGGTVLLMTAFAATVIIGSVALATNVARAYHLQAALTQSADAAALAGAIEYADKKDVQMAQDRAIRYFRSNAPQKFASLERQQVVVDTASGTVTVQTDKKLKTFFLNSPDMMVNALAAASAMVPQTTTSSSTGNLEISLVLDVTTSMGSSGKMPAMKDAVTEFVNTVMPDSSAGNVHIAVVPFNMTVRLDTRYPYHSWLKQGMYDRFLQASLLEPDASLREPWKGCIVNNLPPADTTDRPHYQGKLIVYNEQLHNIDNLTPYPPGDISYSHTPRHRNKNPYLYLASENGGSDAGSGDLNWIMAHLKGKSCTLPYIIPLTENRASIVAHIAAIDNAGYGHDATGNSGTIGSFGMLWAWRTLSPQWRGEWFNSPADKPVDYSNNTVKKSIVFFTDGLGEMPATTVNGELGYGYGAYGFTPGYNWDIFLRYSWDKYGINASTIPQANLALDEKLRQVCNNIKSSTSITIYTVGFGVTGTSDDQGRAEHSIKSCASKPENYYAPDSMEKLSAAFRDIATSIGTVSSSGTTRPARLVR